MNTSKKSDPSVHWDGEKFYVNLPTDGGTIKAEWNPGLTYVVRVREVGEENWLFAVHTPLRSITVSDLKPDTEYEMEIRAKNEAGEGEPVFSRIHTSLEGEPIAKS